MKVYLFLFYVSAQGLSASWEEMFTRPWIVLLGNFTPDFSKQVSLRLDSTYL